MGEVTIVSPPMSIRTCVVTVPLLTSTILPLRTLRALSFTTVLPLARRAALCWNGYNASGARPTCPVPLLHQRHTLDLRVDAHPPGEGQLVPGALGDAREQAVASAVGTQAEQDDDLVLPDSRRRQDVGRERVEDRAGLGRDEREAHGAGEDAQALPPADGA